MDQPTQELHLADDDDASGLARLLHDVRLPEVRAATFVAPPVRTAAFFTDQKAQSSLDRWWIQTVPRGAFPVYLLMHEDGLARASFGASTPIFT